MTIEKQPRIKGNPTITVGVSGCFELYYFTNYEKMFIFFMVCEKDKTKVFEGLNSEKKECTLKRKFDNIIFWID